MSIITQKPKIAKLPEPKVMRPKKTEKVKPYTFRILKDTTKRQKNQLQAIYRQ